jgi:hypothetical protein
VIREEIELIETFEPSRNTSPIDTHVESPPPNLS